MKRYVIFILVLFCAEVVCGQISLPRLRPSPYFGSITGINFGDIDSLGRHNYKNIQGERNPLLYTAKGGYIDMGHLRESADRARYLFEMCQETILKGESSFTFRVIEPAHYKVTLTYPENWNEYSPEEKVSIAREAAIAIGQHLAQQTTIWHEIITWYGYSSMGLLSEQPSSFSWEDTYSDLLGTKLAARVLRDNDQDDDSVYDKAMTTVIEETLKELDPLSADTVRQATQSIDGKWFAGRYPFLTMKKRSFDIGYDDGAISPFRVPKIQDDAPAQPCQVPPLEALDRYGFKMNVDLTPGSSQGRQALAIIYPDGGSNSLDPAKDYLRIIDHIRAEAIQKSGPDVETPTLN